MDFPFGAGYDSRHGAAYTCGSCLPQRSQSGTAQRRAGFRHRGFRIGLPTLGGTEWALAAPTENLRLLNMPGQPALRRTKAGANPMCQSNRTSQHLTLAAPPNVPIKQKDRNSLRMVGVRPARATLSSSKRSLHSGTHRAVSN